MDYDLEAEIKGSAAAKHWEKIGIRHHHGLVVPLFYLHSARSSGIGEYPDLIPLIDWCRSAGFDVIQLLPLNDTGLETSPYSALSAFALNPIHIGLHNLPQLEKYPELVENLKEMPQPKDAPRVDYPAVREAKHRFLSDYYKIAGSSIKESPEYRKFLDTSPWLKQYALFRTLKIRLHWSSWEEWPIELQSPSEDYIRILMQEYREDIDFHCFVQFLCDTQLREVYEHAGTKGVFLMGDIPILINRDSADVWLHRDLFHLDYSAGAPPDVFTPTGQDWGFPIYNWTSLGQLDYKWWIDRLQTTSRYYHIYRIDHIVGFFRIWAIPSGKKCRDGIFIPSDSSVWIEKGNEIMTFMLQHCDMLPIGEDLGDVLPSIKAYLRTMGICGTKVTRWERNWHGDKQYISPREFPALSMTTVSTHDSETLQIWWQNNPEEAKLFAALKGWSYDPVLSHDQRKEILRESHRAKSLFTINLLQEYLYLVPGFTWDNLEQERVNTPGTVSDKNWSCRCRKSIEEIISNPDLNNLLKEITADTE